MRADRNAALVRLPLAFRKRARVNAQVTLTASAPRPTIVSVVGSGGSGDAIFCHTVQSAARPGTSRMTASAIPSRDRACNDQPSASRISRLTEVSSRKSMLSANSETEEIEIADVNSTKK